MALYTSTLSCGQNTSEDNATVKTVEVNEERITKFNCFIDPASNGEARAEVLIGRNAVIPDRSGDPISKPGETKTDSLEIEFDKDDLPQEVKFKFWAPNASFPHDAMFQIETEREDGGWFF